MKTPTKAAPGKKAPATFFRSAAALRRWFGKHHATTDELMVGFYKKGTGKKSITYGEALDEALCFGWIDGVRRSIDATSYMIRFTPRRAASKWSLVNTRRFRQLERLGQVEAAGRAVFRRRDPEKTKEYARENRSPTLAPRYEKQFRGNRDAWRYFAAQPPSYRRLAALWVMSAKREETRARRLAALVAGSAAERRLEVIPGKKSV